jgi:2-methylisocitrate lyase-like PEP mutase family enzyme
MTAAATAICDAVDLPVIADGDTGYGNALNVHRTVREYERAGVAAIQLEDQAFPKRCGHLQGKEVIPAEEMVGKIKAALDARTDPDLLIIARTDARATDGFGAALHRVCLYEEAGADVVFLEAPLSTDELRQVPRAVRVPCLVNMVERGQTPLLTTTELEALGYRIVIFPNTITRFVARQVAEFLADLRATGDPAALLDRMIGFPELQQIVRLNDWLALEQRYQAWPIRTRSRVE